MTQRSAFQLISALVVGASACFGQVDLTILHLFPFGGPSAPECTLVETSPGVFYGTTSTGSGSAGTLFRVTSDGSFAVMHTFDAGTEGASPVGALVQGFDGKLYGVASQGGGEGNGTIFRSNLRGDVEVLHDVSSGTPYSLIQAANGALYGTTSGGEGAYRLSSSGHPQTIHAFTGAEGSPVGPLTQASDGNFYGVTSVGIYRLTPGGAFQMLHPFSGLDGSSPVGNLAQSRDGRLYGVNAFGGAHNFGTVYSISLAGGFRVDHAFTGGADFGYPLTGTARANDGFVYGATGLGPGQVFRVGGGTYEVVVTLPSTMPGGNPNFPSPAVVQGSDGKLYGVQTTFGGSVYSLDVGLTPPLPRAGRLTPNAGPVGTKVAVFGVHLLGATNVAFNGVPAPFVVGSGNVIYASVPAGATSGPITVATPNGIAQTREPFEVTASGN